MMYLIFIGDMLVMAFMAALVVWLYVKADDKLIDETSRIPLEDEK